MFRGRFAPTPSGLMHIGNLYTALLAWLQARSRNGAFLLRMEDLDAPRSKPEWAAQIVDDLRWFGLDWDEGPDVGGPYGPYTQSERAALYEAAFNRLRARGLLYPCYCSRAELSALASAPHGLPSEGPAYPGTCRTLSAAERERRAAEKHPSYRYAVPSEHEVQFVDAVYGPLAFPPGAGGDFVVRRADGIMSYQLAVVVDDAAMGITDVLRGADLLDSAPRQLWLYEALGLRPPNFAHVPLLCDSHGERLSKRQKSLTVAKLREQGVRPEAVAGIIAHLARLTDRFEPLQPKELITSFDLGKLGTEPLRLPDGAFT